MAQGTARRHVDFNEDAAEKLREMADLLKQQHANPFRIQAYVRAAQTVESCEQDLRDLLASEGVAGLDKLPFIGRGIASCLQELARYGRLGRLDRLRGRTGSRGFIPNGARCGVGTRETDTRDIGHRHAGRA